MPSRPPADWARITRSATATGAEVATMERFGRWFESRRRTDSLRVDRVPLDELTGWHRRAGTADVVHDSGKFFSVRGLRVRTSLGPVHDWTQPIFDQPEIGVLGIVVKEFNGVLHCLMQAKAEPGDPGGVQLSPTVQATKSNYTQVHGGRPVPYLDHFRQPAHHRVLADVLQSEQGSWFYRKRNRNIAIEVTEDVEVLDGFHWLTIGQLHRLLAVDNIVNMDARTVLSCLPFSGPGLADGTGEDDELSSAVARSSSTDQPSRHSMGELLSWITDSRVRNEVDTTLIPLSEVAGWRLSAGRLSHHTGAYFDVLGVSVRAARREVGSWSQPMIEPTGQGVVAFMVKSIGGVLHALVNARVEPGYLDVVELAPTVQCNPENYGTVLAGHRPPFLDEVLASTAEQRVFDTVLSEEGGRFYHATNRYLIVWTEPDRGLACPPDFRWITLAQLGALLQHSHYVNVQARTLVACLHSLRRPRARRVA
ncbi:NDP-hexose 2,3-dehydratase family protein [Amycolatopsis sp. A133]|uniref:NDP-hexose 2,3-dehydratase family protein n=1 Tax=Amycolatopsis sp. A133 TaxID=3064472 RepID=UPI0027EBE189|nr:NDP-hexose 2,3-dehydratase family protein [Amycolatopsis sp. A133]MDQ7807637.1 NDP-hexose 2,3-dehydratase family protein [Amycolatopsis sp. A133]